MSAQLDISAPRFTPVDFDPFAGSAEALLYVAPATEAQQELWNAVQLGADASCAFNECISLRLRGTLDIDALRRAVLLVVERNEALRTTFAPGGEQFCVSVAPVCDLRIEERSGEELEAWRRQAVSEPFDLVHGPLFRVWLARVTDQESELILGAHHIVCDGWAMGVIVAELAASYSAYREGRTPDLEEPQSYLDYAELQRAYLASQEFRDDERYWIGRFADHVPQLDLPLDRARPPSRGYDSHRVDHWVTAQTVAAFKRMAARHGCSLSVATQAVFRVLLHRLTGESSIVVGMPAAGQVMFGRERLVGHCVNLLPVRVDLDPDKTFAELLQQHKSALHGAFDHQKYTYGSLLKRLAFQRDPARMPLISVMFNLDPGWTPEHGCFAGLETEIHSNPRRFENFELFVNGVGKEGGLILEVQYKTELFDCQTIAGWMNSYHHLLEQFAADPELRIGRAPMLAPKEFARVIYDWNATQVPTNDLRLVHEAVAEQARRTPDAIAIVDGQGTTRYGEVEARSNQLARYLIRHGIRPGKRVGVAVERGADMVIALLAVLKAGGAYVPLDPDYPHDRLEYMLRMSETEVVVTDSARKAQLPLGGAHAVCVDADRAHIKECSARPLADEDGPRPSAKDVAYVIFTSGSTGLPKGVQVLHLGVANFLRSMSREPGIESDDVLLAVTTLSFDIAVLELYLPLIAGAQLVIASRDEAMDAHRLAEMMVERNVTVLQATPATWRMLLASGWQGALRLKALCGGEALTRDLAAALLTRTRELWNMYGPTETTVWSTCHRIGDAEGPISIGRPLDNTQVYILNDAGLPQPPGAAGELLIAGDGVALGYLGRDDLTAERFLPDPFVAGGRMYRTGDLGRWCSDGLLECLGRNDGQVKVRGFRIEIGEIEAVLMNTGLLAECSVIVREDTPGDQRLTAYYASERDVGAEELKAAAQKKLPAYMVPQGWLQMQALPKTLNGKIDRKRLPKPDAARVVEKTTGAGPRTQTERFLHGIWQEVLKRGDFGVHDDFFMLGGHSLLATQLLARIQQAGRAAPSLRELFQRPTIEKLAEWIDQHAAPQAAVRIPHRAGRVCARLSAMQMRVWYLEQINPGTATYNLPAAFRFNGEFDPQAAQAAWRDILARHAALRTRIAIENGEAVQRIEETVDSDLPLVECSERDMFERVNADGARPFDLTHAPLVRGMLFRLDPQTHALYFVAHHLVWDGWSFDVFLREFKELYEAHLAGRAPALAPLEISYGDYCDWQGEEVNRSQALAEERSYWLRQLSAPLPVLDLPTDRPRPAEMSFRGATHEFHWDEATVARMSEFARSQGVTLQMFLLAGFKTLLSCLSGSSDIIVGTPIQGRTVRETEDLIGFFVNTLALRTRVDAQLTFAQLLQKVRETCLDAYSRQNMPFETLVQALKPKRDMSRTPVFQCFFTYQDVARREWTLGKAAVEQFNVHTGVVPTDVSLWVKVGHHGLVGGFDYAVDLFDPQTVRRWAQEYLELLSTAMLRAVATVAELGSAVASGHTLQRRDGAVEGTVAAQPGQQSLSVAATGTQAYLMRLWQEYLGVEQIRPTDNFFDLGGHSLLSMEMIARIERETGKRLSPRLILLSSLGQIAGELGGDEKTETVDAVPAKREATPFFFADGLFGTLHSPQAHSRTGVLICAPIGQEYMRTHWLLRQLANSLVRSGVYVLRFDYFGCGDSAGASLEGGPRRWEEDVHAAAEEFRRRVGIERLVAVGVRMGGYLAASALPETELILWDPVESGSEYLTELESFHRKKFDGRPPTDDTGLGGFDFSPALRAEIARLKLAPQLERLQHRVQIIRSSELGEDVGWCSMATWNHAVLSTKILQALRTALAEAPPGKLSEASSKVVPS